MQQYSLFTNEYDADIEILLKKRLAAENSKSVVERVSDDGKAVTVITDAETDIWKLSCAVCEMMLNDLKYFEMTRLANNLPPAVNNIASIIEEASKTGGVYPFADDVKQGIFEYLSETDTMNLEGYLRFRLKDVIERWSVFIDAAADEMMLINEFNELTKLLGLFTVIEPPRSGKLTVILNPDGSCTITNYIDGNYENEGFRIDCAEGSNEGVINMLIGMSPSSITLHDLSFGRCDKLKAAIETVFGARLNGD
ncbi:MAG: hypothetical protein IKS90_03605 [Clostridia bacterium]|nr:hypothetical protein [Clostridia bacterium]